ncbi:hypothetical protein [Paenibacillus andongensis]|uniref:hypothetical protein n=1 Tax=Paenibacillus andongensis TaxID=2975482 RepID=UPI0021BABCF3|nr:hypothetical protein [Paenibacillus andongensis]
MDINTYALEKMMAQRKTELEQSLPMERKVKKENETSWLVKLQPAFINRVGLVR